MNIIKFQVEKYLVYLLPHLRVMPLYYVFVVLIYETLNVVLYNLKTINSSRINLFQWLVIK